MTLIDRTFLRIQLSKDRIMLKNTPLVVREIDSNKHITTEFVNLDLYILEHYNVNDRPVKVLLRCQAFVMNNLRAKMLIEMNILDSKNIDLIISTRIEHIESYFTVFELNVKSSTRVFIQQSVMLDKSIAISAHSQISISIALMKLSFDDYVFESIDEYSIALFAVVVNSSFYTVLTRNDFDESIHLSKRLQVRFVMNLEVDECYHLQNIE